MRDTARLSGKPLAETLQPSDLSIGPGTEDWVTSPDLVEKGLPFAPDVIYDLNVFLLANPNLNSSCLFRGDILFDSLGVLKTPEHEERSFGCGSESGSLSGTVEPVPARSVAGFGLTRTVVRRLIPRNPRLDRPLEQTCHFYQASESDVLQDENISGRSALSASKRILFILTPHLSSKDDIPFYHPMLRGVAFLYDFKYDPTTPVQDREGALSLYFLPFGEPILDRLDRTLSALLNTQVRLARNSHSSRRPDGGNRNPIKDNVLPRHRVQNTYSWLKMKYAQDLCRRWVEETEPSKHVFEDLAIAAFFIELWRNMYGVTPVSERDEKKDAEEHGSTFPGFVDVACGNGVLVYVLLMEGYQGWGFDARRRKSWSIFPESAQEKLKEAIYIPKPFSDAVTASGAESDLDLGAEILTGMFPKDTFIISNHADELTFWTPLMAVLSSPELPLPFLSIPCCSHSLSGARHRYPPPKGKSQGSRGTATSKSDDSNNEPEQNEQPQTGDLKALRAERQDSQTDAGMYNSTYGCLTAKTMGIAEEIGYEVERTLLRIPSTRNMGVVGGRRRIAQEWRRRLDKPHAGEQSSHNGDTRNEIMDRVNEIVYRECAREGGVEAAAKIWIQRAKGLHKGQGSHGIDISVPASR